MRSLALGAILLLSLLPGLGRLAGTQADGGAWAQICTVAGLEQVWLAPGDANPLEPPAAGGGQGDLPGDEPGMDCAFCPLLAAIVVLLPWWLPALSPHARHRLPTGRPEPQWKFRHPSGLGSRGPPSSP